MEIRTSRFGTVEVEEDRLITFPRGLLGFGSAKRFCLLRPNDDACFYWLQCADDPALAFVVTDPHIFVRDYTVPIRTDQIEGLRLDRLEDAQVLVIVNKVGKAFTANLQGPLVVNTSARVAEQFVLADKRWTTRHELLVKEEAARAMSA